MNTISESTDIAEKSRKHRRGSLQVYESMREDILWLRIDPGSAIDEVALAERFKISRTPIREALLLLSGDDLVKFLPNRTTIVAPWLICKDASRWSSRRSKRRTPSRHCALIWSYADVWAPCPATNFNRNSSIIFWMPVSEPGFCITTRMPTRMIFGRYRMTGTLWWPVSVPAGLKMRTGS